MSNRNKLFAISISLLNLVTLSGYAGEGGHGAGNIDTSSQKQVQVQNLQQQQQQQQQSSPDKLIFENEMLFRKWLDNNNQLISAAMPLFDPNLIAPAYRFEILRNKSALDHVEKLKADNEVKVIFQINEPYSGLYMISSDYETCVFNSVRLFDKTIYTNAECLSVFNMSNYRAKLK